MTDLDVRFQVSRFKPYAYASKLLWYQDLHEFNGSALHVRLGLKRSVLGLGVNLRKPISICSSPPFAIRNNRFRKNLLDNTADQGCRFYYDRTKPSKTKSIFCSRCQISFPPLNILLPKYLLSLIPSKVSSKVLRIQPS